MKPLVKKAKLRDMLLAGKSLEELFDFTPGQECEIFKAKKFLAGDEVIYIPDIQLNDLLTLAESGNELEINEIVECCYTGNDFVKECSGDTELAERLFWYCDWQHPSSALQEVEDDGD